MPASRFRGLAIGAITLGLAAAASAGDDLAAGFQSPPDSAKPHTWWHWMNGNITREGITADLEAMKQVGLGGAQIFNVSESIPEGPIKYNSSEWRALVKFAAQEAQRLGLELCIHNCAGWSSSGGPWVTPQDAMQTVVTSEFKTRGPMHFAAELPQPPKNATHDFYRDIAVLAFPTPSDDAFRIADIKAKVLSGQYRYGLMPSLDVLPAGAAIKRDSVVDLTANFKNGTLEWDAPDGEWTIMRLGYTPTGAVCAPAPASGRGLEVDKMSREALDRFWAGGMAPLIKELGPLAGTVLNNVLVDSYEMGAQNWTPKFREEFQKRRGYDPLLYLPALAGRVIDSGEISERFLWDFRRTVGDLFAANYFDRFGELCKENGLLFSVEPYDGPFECSQVGRHADIPMGEFWVTSGMSYSCKLASSVAHVWGKPIVGAEAFTAEPSVGRWLNWPGSLKAVGDLMYTEGINRYIIHRYAHQPWLHIEPGMTMGQWGTHFERTSTWWEHGGPEWVKYLARCQFLLQQGKFAADVLYFAGESSPNGAPHEIGLKAKGYDYDTCGLDALMSAKVKDGKIVLAGGMSYELLALPDAEFMTAEAARRVTGLPGAGATVVGPAPLHSPTLNKLSTAERDVRLMGTLEIHESHTGSVRPVIIARPIGETIADRIKPDFKSSSASGSKPNTPWIHRIVGDTDLYFVSNQKPRSEEIDCSFRITGKLPQLWHPDTGVIEPAPVWREESGRTIVSTRFDPHGSVFIVFRPAGAGSKPAAADHIVSVRPPATVTEQARPPNIEIKKATYEAVDAAGGADVTAKVAAMVEGGATEIGATNGNFGDPTYNHVKRLRVEYTIDGKAMTKEAPENAMLVLVPPAPDKPASYVVRTAPFSRTELERVAPGRYEARVGGAELLVFQPGLYDVSTSDGKTRRFDIKSVPAPLAITGPWSIRFQPGRGAPDQTKFDTLASWTDSADPGIKYFSGTATYEKEFDLPADILGPGARANYALTLDLGAVREIAEVTLNSKPLPTLWKPPYSLDISSAAKAGRNRLVVKVTNLWVNRLIGDEQFPEDEEWQRAPSSPLKAWPAWFASQAGNPGATLAARPVKERLTFTTWKHWSKDSPLLESGLIGPVVVRVGAREALSP